MFHLNFSFPSDPQYWSDKYRRSLSEPEEWILVARNIIHSMDCLRPAVMNFWKAAVGSPASLKDQKAIHGVYLMLASYALENLFKAALIKERKWGSDAFSHGLPSELDTHDLAQLANTVGVGVNDVVEELLKRLSVYAYWAGRYPAPTKEKFIRPTKLTDTVTNIPTYWRGRDLRSIEVVLMHLHARLGAPMPSRDFLLIFGDPPEQWEGGVLYENISPWSEAHA